MKYSRQRCDAFSMLEGCVGLDSFPSFLSFTLLKCVCGRPGLLDGHWKVQGSLQIIPFCLAYSQIEGDGLELASCILENATENRFFEFGSLRGFNSGKCLL